MILTDFFTLSPLILIYVTLKSYKVGDNRSKTFFIRHIQKKNTYHS